MTSCLSPGNSNNVEGHPMDIPDDGIGLKEDIPDGVLYLQETISDSATGLKEDIPYDVVAQQDGTTEGATCLQDDIPNGGTGLKDIPDGATDLQEDAPNCASGLQKNIPDGNMRLQDEICFGVMCLKEDTIGTTGLEENILDSATCLHELIPDGVTGLQVETCVGATPCGAMDIQDGILNGVTGSEEDIPDGVTSVQEDIHDGDTGLQKDDPNGVTCLEMDIPDDATGIQDDTSYCATRSKEDIPVGHATSIHDDIPDGATGTQEDVRVDATRMQDDIPDGATGTQDDVRDGATTIQDEIPDGTTGTQDDVTDGATSMQDEFPDGATGQDLPSQHASQLNGIDEPTAYTKVDRFGFTGGKQFEENRDTHLPISVIRKRELKWLDMLEDWPKWMSKKPKKVKERCRKGIPSALRARAWQYLSGSKNIMEKKKLVFAELDAQDGDPTWVEMIEKDLDRQFPFHEMFAKGGGGQHDLFRILKAYSIHNPRDGYCQAQAPIAAVLVMQMPAEEAFWCLVQICEKYLVGYFSPGLEAMQIDGDVLLGLMKRHLTTTYRHMVEQHIEPVHYMTEWFMCIFSRTFPFASVLRVWDIFLCEGVKVLFKVALVIIKHTLSSKRQLEECPGFYETIQKLKHIPSHVVEEDFLINEVIEMRVFEKEFEAEHSLQVARRKAVKQRQLRHSNQVEMAKQVAEIKQKKKIKAKSKVQLKKPLSQSYGSLNFLSSDHDDGAIMYSLPNTPAQRRLEERSVQSQSSLNGSKAHSADELEFEGYLQDQPENGFNGTKTEGKVKKAMKKAKDKKKAKIK